MLHLRTHWFLFQQMKNQKTGWSYSKMDFGRRECLINCTMKNVITSSDSHDGRKIVSKWLWLCWKVAVINKYLNNCLQDQFFLFREPCSKVHWAQYCELVFVLGLIDGFGGGNQPKMCTRMVSGYKKIVSKYNIIDDYVAAQTFPNEYRVFLKLFIKCLIEILREPMV